MAFNSNNNEYTIITDSEAESVIQYWTSDMIMDLVKSNITTRYRSYIPNLTNIVKVFESNFKNYTEQYPNYSMEFESKRIDIYKSIIQILCQSFNLDFIADQDSLDFYSAAFYLYGFLVSDFATNIVQFFANYILKEKNALYELLDTTNLKKVKDSSSAYSKKLYRNTNTKLAVIHANLEATLDNICASDINISVLLDNIYYGDKNISKYIQNLVVERGDLFKNNFIQYIEAYKPIIITNVRLALQSDSVTEINDIL